MDGQSFDIKRDRLQRLKELFPELFTESQVDWEKLKAAFGDDINFANERYVLNWAGKSDAFRVLQQPTTATLKPISEESLNFDTTENIFIEGENLEVLKVLQKAYYGKVKVVCIDPPYNTGSDSFIYPDRFSEKKEDYLKRIGDKDEEGFLMKEGLFRKNSKDSGHFHSNWLSMMYPRLFLAKNLLRDDGVIFVHIDDNEVHNLRMVMNEIFGEENFITCLIWNTEGHTDNQFQVKVNHEYVLLYAKNSLKTNLGYVIDPNTRKDSNLWKGYAENSITKNGPGNPPSEVILPIGFPCKVSAIDISATKIESSFYKEVAAQGYISRALTQKYNVEYPIRKDTMKCRDGKLIQECRVYSGWANVNKLKEFIANDCNEILDDEGSKSRFYLSENGVIYYKKEREKARNILSVLRNFGTTEQMRSEIEEMGVLFQYPKPKQLIKYLIQIGCDNDDIILDFFSGSGTTAQAIVELNKEDGGNRKFILVQMPEPCNEDSEAFKAGYKTIADIGKERIHRVIQKINKEVIASEAKQSQGNLLEATKIASSQAPRNDNKSALGFKVFKLSLSNFKIWRGAEIDSEEKLTQQLDAFTNPIKPNAEKKNMLYELMLKAGYELTSQVQYVIASGAKQSQKGNDSAGYYSINNNELIIALDAMNEKLIEQIIAAKPQKVITLDSLFTGNDQLKTNTVLQMRDAGVDFKTI